MRQAAARRALDGVALAVFAVYLVAGTVHALGHAVRKAADFDQARHETVDGARARMYGEDFTRAVDEIRGELAVDQPYLLAEAGRPATGGAYWVRYELAPRPSIYLGEMKDLTDANRLRGRLEANLRQVVVTHNTRRPPELYPRYLFVREIERRAHLQAPPQPTRPTPRTAPHPRSAAPPRAPALSPRRSATPAAPPHAR